ncbi:MAG: class I SAM-dependent methyltransferase [Phycisphaerae bacterium]|jgi:hypothetical protein
MFGLGLRRKAARVGCRLASGLLGIKPMTLGEVAIEEWLVHRLLDPEVGKAYGVTAADKKRLVAGMQAACAGIRGATGWQAHLVMATQILRIPPQAEGVVVECGCYTGASTASLSLVCRMTGRQLLVFDSFQGLPSEGLQLHHYPHKQVYGYYKEGMYAASLELVKANVARYGHLPSCRMVPGFFCDTLVGLDQPVVFAWLDVDLLSSLTDCIRHIWPRLMDGGYIYTDDSSDMEVVRIWFDEPWWKKEFGIRPPGYVGTGSGLTLNLHGSSLGYAQKVVEYATAYGRIEWLHYPDREPEPAGKAAGAGPGAASD